MYEGAILFQKCLLLQVTEKYIHEVTLQPMYNSMEQTEEVGPVTLVSKRGVHKY